MSLKFSREDFQCQIIGDLNKEIIVSIGHMEKAQAIFDKWLAEQPTVYGFKHSEVINEVIGAGPTLFDMNYDRMENNTHQGKLVDIKEIEKTNPCEHGDVYLSNPQIKEIRANPEGIIIGNCGKCGIPLRTKWEEIP